MGYSPALLKFLDRQKTYSSVTLRDTFSKDYFLDPPPLFPKTALKFIKKKPIPDAGLAGDNSSKENEITDRLNRKKQSN
jgi:hypothetical protein